MKKILKFLFHRVVLVALALALQAGLLVLMLVKFNEYFVYFYAICIALSLAAVLKIVNGDSNPGYKIADSPRAGFRCAVLYHPRRQKAEPPDQGENAPCGGQNAAGAAAAGGAAR